MRIFQVVILLIFGFALVIGVLIFSGILPGWQQDDAGTGGTVVLWGTIPANEMEPFLRFFGSEHQGEFTLRYVAKSPATFETEYLQALALGQGPDLVFFPDDMIVRFGDTFQPIPYENFSERSFKDTFIEGAEIYLTKSGVLALPVWSDPLVMYYNRRLMNNAGITQVPRSWSQVISYIDQLAEIDSRRNVVTSAVALGEFANVVNAKDILSMLILQTGNPITDYGFGGLESFLAAREQEGEALAPAVAAVEFFNQFANQSKSTFTWSRAMPLDREAFLAEKLVIYFGLASEYSSLRTNNPNLNFDIAVVPQRDQVGDRKTSTSFEAIGVVKSSSNKATAFQVAFLLASAPNASRISDLIGLPPVRRDLLSQGPVDDVRPVLYQSAIIGESWLDPEPNQTELIMANMAQDVLLNRKAASEAVLDADQQIDYLFETVKN